MPPRPCQGCRHEGGCVVAGIVCRLALQAWVDEKAFSCPDYEPEYFHGIDGVFA